MENVPKANPNFVVTLYFGMKMLPMVISLICIYLGYKLFILGVTGQASLSIESKTVSGQLINAAPGLFFAVGGLIALTFSIIKGVKINFNNKNGGNMNIKNMSHE
jgi:hypothetical protein